MRVLICPLDWGLGHATRCIPVIRQLLEDNHEVMVAGSGASLELLRLEFPSLFFFRIPTATMRHFSEWPALRLLLQAGKFRNMIEVEKKETARIVKNEKIDRIISDNRYGCRYDGVRSAIIIHQVSIRTPPLFKPIVNSVNNTLINGFNECWIPDTADHRLSGSLSVNGDIPARFIGPLSRMRNTGSTQRRFELLALISGPEPARTDFENILTAQLTNSGRSYRIVQGLPSSGSSDANTFSHLASSQLNELIEAAEVVICRSGYSTIMDLAALKKKAIFVPTPGQTEQLYLAGEMQRKKIAPTMSQKQFNLQQALSRLKDYTGFTEDYFNNTLLQTTLREFLD
jgi:UDP-N-acetylglucosamine transferase subunit ALG13